MRQFLDSHVADPVGRPTRSMRRVAGVVAAGAMVACTTAVLAGSSVTASPSTSLPREALSAQEGIGDPYFPQAGNPGYRVRHYDIDVSYTPATRVLAGTTTVVLRAAARLPSFNLDLLLRASRVTVNGTRADFSQGRHELTVRPSEPVGAGEVARVAVTYRGKPIGIGYGGETPFEKTATGAIAVGEPPIAAWWFPSNDHPSDKATFTTTLTVPRGYEAISNGALTGRRTTKGVTVWTWSVRSQLATYLAFAAFGQYDVQRGRTASGIPYLYAFEHGLGDVSAAARRSVRSTPSILRWLEQVWGGYPYENVGGVVPNVRLGYALENQTRPVYGRDMFRYGPYRSLVVHELAHQWFGDRVAVRRWRHIWLNEGYATYSEWLWSRHNGGRTPQQQLRVRYDNLEASNPFWKLEIGDPGRERLFDSAVYDRGAMTLQALRNRLGTRAFFRVSRQWVRGNADGLGSTRELKLLAERVSGEQLDGLFKAWLFSGSKPAPTRANGL
ncbi:MAG: M1 family metallopeptidase [Nocardioidaceae bacterium]